MAESASAHNREGGIGRGGWNEREDQYYETEPVLVVLSLRLYSGYEREAY